MEREIDEYIHNHLDIENNVLNELYRYTHLNVPYSGMVSDHIQGRLLSMLSHMVRPEHILEIGAFTGYSAICLAEGLSEKGHLYTIELDDERAEIASAFIEKAGVTDRITLLVGDALEIIPKLDIVFDLIFIDAAKKQYMDYYHAIFDKVRPGGYIMVDNILWYGQVADPKVQDEMTNELRRFNDFIQCDVRVEKAIVQNRDGLFILRKKMNKSDIRTFQFLSSE